MGGVVSCLAASCACNTASCCAGAVCNCFGKAVPFGTATKTRLLYVLVFLLAIMTCWVFVAFGPSIAAKFPHWLYDPTQFCEDHKCFGPLTVYRISFGLALFHGLFALLLVGVRTTSDFRASLQNGFWLFKILGLIGLIICSFLIPAKFYVVYGYTALVAGVVFLFFQLVLLVDFAHSWSESWLQKYGEREENKGWLHGLMFCTAVLFLASFVLVCVMYALFTSADEMSPESSCGLNAVFITVALLSGIALSCLAVHPKVQQYSPQSGLLQPAVVFFYMIFLVWSAIMSEPTEGATVSKCNALTRDGGPFSGGQTLSVAMGALLVLVAVCYSAVRTSSKHNAILGGGSDTATEKTGLVKSSQSSSIAEVAAAAEGDGDDAAGSGGVAADDMTALEDGVADADVPEAKEATPVGYSYSFFHFIFMLASMYVCMLMTNWRLGSVDESNMVIDIRIDQSMTSVWIKAVSSWVVALLFAWSLLAPVLMPNRDFA